MEVGIHLHSHPLSQEFFDHTGLFLTFLENGTKWGASLGWYVVNDGVMGGRSEGGFEIVDGELHFTGNTNEE